MSSGPQPRETALNIAPYVPGRASADDGVETIKLSSNENPFGASLLAQQAVKDGARRLAVYPDGPATALRQAIADSHGLDPDRIVCGAGSDEILNLLAQGYLQAGDEAIYTEHGFLVYPIAVMAAGGTPVKVAERDLTADVDAILAALTPATKIVFLANPNNPTGTYLAKREVERLHAGLPADVLLVLDGAYAEYLAHADYDPGVWLVDQASNVVMTRTFSKIYGLAGLRLGWCYGPPAIIDLLHRIRGPFNVSGVAIDAGIAALQDQNFIKEAVAHNSRWLAELPRQLVEIGLETTPSVGNFILIHFPDDPGRRAADADAFLLSHGYVLRRVENYGLPHSLRMSIGTDAQNQGVLAVLKIFMTREAASG